MSIDGVYHVYCLGANHLKKRYRPFFSEFSLLEVESNGQKLRIYTNAEADEVGNVALTGSGPNPNKQCSWQRQGNPAWEAQARFVDDIQDSSAKLLVGWVTRGNLKDVFVAIKAEADTALLTSPPEYKVYYKENSTIRDLAITLENETTKKLNFAFGNPDGGSETAQTPGAQTPGRFNAGKTGNSQYSIVGFRLPRFIKVTNSQGQPENRALLVGHLVKGTLGAAGYDPSGTDDLEPFVAVSTTPPGEEGSPF